MPYIATMCPDELKRAVEFHWPLLIASGAIEYHGGQLPLGTDLLIVEGVLREVEKRVPVVIAPPFAYSPTGYMVSGPEKGTVDIGVDIFINHCSEILNSYMRMGFRNICVLVHHQGDSIGTLIKAAALKVNAYGLHHRYGNGWWTENCGPEQPCRITAVPAIIGGTKAFGGHGGKGETQAMMALYPDMVKLEKLTDTQPFWNASAGEADSGEARREMESVIAAWVNVLSAK